MAEIGHNGGYIYGHRFFSGFSVCFCINEEKVIRYQLWVRKITCRRFDWMLQSSSLSPWWWLEHSVETSASCFLNSKLVTDNLLFIHRLFPYMHNFPSLALYPSMNIQLTSNIIACASIVTNGKCHVEQCTWYCQACYKTVAIATLERWTFYLWMVHRCLGWQTPSSLTYLLGRISLEERQG